MKRGGGRVIDEGDRHIGGGDRAESDGSGAAAAARHPGRSKIEGLHGLGHSRTCAGQERPEEERYQAQPIYKGCAGTGGAVTIRTAKQQGIQHPVFSCRAGRAALAEEPYSDLACPKLPMLVSCKGDRLKTPRQETNGDTPFMKNGQKMSGSDHKTNWEVVFCQRNQVRIDKRQTATEPKRVRNKESKREAEAKKQQASRETRRYTNGASNRPVVQAGKL